VLQGNDNDLSLLGSVVDHVRESTNWCRPDILIDRAIQRRVGLYPSHLIPHRLDETISQADLLLLVCDVGSVYVVPRPGKIDHGR
jgi:hypothetical protein